MQTIQNELRENHWVKKKKKSIERVEKKNTMETFSSATGKTLILWDLLRVTVRHNVHQGISIIKYSERVFYLCAQGSISRLPGQTGRTQLDYEYNERKEEKRKGRGN